MIQCKNYSFYNSCSTKILRHFVPQNDKVVVSGYKTGGQKHLSLWTQYKNRRLMPPFSIVIYCFFSRQGSFPELLWRQLRPALLYVFCRMCHCLTAYPRLFLWWHVRPTALFQCRTVFPLPLLQKCIFLPFHHGCHSYSTGDPLQSVLLN